jgi:hypothetical protein
MKRSIASAYGIGAEIPQTFVLSVLGMLVPKMPILRATALIASSIIAAGCITLSAFSQTSIDDGWNLLRDLPQETRIHVVGTKIDKTCNFLSADDEKLVCASGRTTSASLMTFSRPALKSVKLTFLAESALAGASIRAASSRFPRAVTENQNPDGIDRLSNVILGAAVLADRLMTCGKGGSIDVLRGSTIYLRSEPHA